MGCPACSDTGFVIVDHVSAKARRIYGPKARVQCAARCLCAMGHQIGSAVPSVDTVLPPDDLRQLFPTGAPTMPDLSLRDYDTAGIPVAYRNWRLDTFPDRRTKYVDMSLTWARTPSTERCDLVLFGPPGVGKTGLAVGMLRKCMERRERGRFIDANMMLQAVRDTYNAARGGQSEGDVLRDLMDVGVLVLDDLTAVRASDFYQDTLHLIVDGRNKERRPTILTMNATEEEIPALLGPALADRMRARALFWKLAGTSKRPSRESIQAAMEWTQR